MAKGKKFNSTAKLQKLQKEQTTGKWLGAWLKPRTNLTKLTEKEKTGEANLRTPCGRGEIAAVQKLGDSCRLLPPCCALACLLLCLPGRAAPSIYLLGHELLCRWPAPRPSWISLLDRSLARAPRHCVPLLDCLAALQPKCPSASAPSLE